MVSDVAAGSTRHQDLDTQFFVFFKQQDFTSPFGSARRGHQPRGSRSNDDNVPGVQDCAFTYRSSWAVKPGGAPFEVQLMADSSASDPTKTEIRPCPELLVPSKHKVLRTQSRPGGESMRAPLAVIFKAIPFIHKLDASERALATTFASAQ